MPNWRRAHVPGGTYFFTVVTDRRNPLFAQAGARALLGTVLRASRRRWPYQTNAIVLLPDHLHVIWTLPRCDAAYSRRWAWIKRQFTRRWTLGGGGEEPVSAGRRRDGRRGVWQPKFWEHTIESADDFERHFDYIHYNPVKHGLVRCPRDWPWSSFRRYVRLGVYPENWACWNQPHGTPHFDDLTSTAGE